MNIKSKALPRLKLKFTSGLFADFTIVYLIFCSVGQLYPLSILFIVNALKSMLSLFLYFTLLMYSRIELHLHFSAVK